VYFFGFCWSYAYELVWFDYELVVVCKMKEDNKMLLLKADDLTPDDLVKLAHLFGVSRE